MKFKFVFKPIYYGYIGYIATALFLAFGKLSIICVFIACGILLITSAYCCFVIFANYQKEKAETEDMIARIAYTKTVENNGVNPGDALPFSQETYKQVKKYRRQLLTPICLHLFVFLSLLVAICYQIFM